MSKYSKITKEEVLSLMNGNRLTVDFYDVMFSIGMIADSLNSSKYQVSKIMNELRSEGLIYYGSYSGMCQPDYESGDCYCDNHLPVWGWRLNKKAIDESVDCVAPLLYNR